MMPLAAMVLLVATATENIPAMVKYSSCQIEAAGRLDHGGDVTEIARAVAAHCDTAYQAMIAEVTKDSKIRAFVSNYDSAYWTVWTARSLWNWPRNPIPPDPTNIVIAVARDGSVTITQGGRQVSCAELAAYFERETTTAKRPAVDCKLMKTKLDQ